jgi:hypothetical protein
MAIHRATWSRRRWRRGGRGREKPPPFKGSQFLGLLQQFRDFPLIFERKTQRA